MTRLTRRLNAKKAKATQKVKRHVVKKVMTDEDIEAKEGSYFDGKGCLMLRASTDVYDEEGHLLAKFRKGVFSKDTTDLGWEAFHQAAAASRSRGAAAGPINPNSEYWKKRKIVENRGWWATYEQDGKVAKMRVNNTVFSSVVGYFEKTPFAKVPCRMTSYTQKFFEGYKRGIPFIQAINREFKRLVPGPYQKQLNRIKATPAYRIADTAFSSVTINRNFRTALHKDAGDYREGYGNLTVLERGRYHGGETLFPQYGVGFDLRSGDFIAMDVHQWHCNTAMYETAEDKAYNKTLAPIKTYENSRVGAHGERDPWTRISFVCYVREKLDDCDLGETKAYYKRIGFDPEKGHVT